jgi:hypothetical protein
MAVLNIGRLGVEPTASVPALVKVLNDRDPLVREGATNALKKIAPELFRTSATSGE